MLCHNSVGLHEYNVANGKKDHRIGTSDKIVIKSVVRQVAGVPRKIIEL